MTAVSVSVQKYISLYEETTNVEPFAPYKLLEFVFRYYCPDFEIPQKWSNVTRYATTHMEKGIIDVPVFCQSKKQCNKSIGHYCNIIGLTENVLNGYEKKQSPVSVGAFREMYLYKKSCGKTWCDVKNWLFNILPVSDI